MPIVQIELLEGRTIAQKRALVKEVTEAVCRTVGAKPEAVRIILRDMKFEDFAASGVLRLDQK